MNFNQLFASTNVSATGLSAERLRMEVVANNIANAFSTRTPDGGPFRRQEVVFASFLDEETSLRHRSGNSIAGSREALRDGLSGVQVVSREDDPSPFRRVHIPGHPDADEQGVVNMPNVDLPIEMVNLITASRAYEANLRAMQVFRQMAELSLAIMKH